jgi:hypothetical protein
MGQSLIKKNCEQAVEGLFSYKVFTRVVNRDWILV